MNYLRNLTHPSPQWVRERDRRHRLDGLHTFYVGDEQHARDFRGMPTQEQILSLRERHEPTFTLVEAHYEKTESRHYTDVERQAEQFSGELGAACILHYFNETFRHPQQPERTMPPASMNTIIAPFFDEIVRQPIGSPRRLTSTRSHLESWILVKDDPLSLAASMTQAYVEHLTPTIEMLGDRFNLGAFCIGGMIGGIGVIEAVGSLREYSLRTPRAYKA